MNPVTKSGKVVSRSYPNGSLGPQFACDPNSEQIWSDDFQAYSDGTDLSSAGYIRGNAKEYSPGLIGIETSDAISIIEPGSASRKMSVDYQRFEKISFSLTYISAQSNRMILGPAWFFFSGSLSIRGMGGVAIVPPVSGDKLAIDLYILNWRNGTEGRIAVDFRAEFFVNDSLVETINASNVEDDVWCDKAYGEEALDLAQYAVTDNWDFSVTLKE